VSYETAAALLLTISELPVAWNVRVAKPIMGKKIKNIIITGYLVVVLLWAIAGQYIHILRAPQTESIAYSQFKRLVKERMVAELTVGARSIQGTIKAEGVKSVFAPEKMKEIAHDAKSPLHFVTLRVDDPNLSKELEEAGIPFAGEATYPWLPMIFSWTVPVVLIFVLWSYFLKRMGPGSGVMQIGKSKAKVYIEKKTGVVFSDVEGIDESKEELIEVVQFLKNPERYQRLGGRIPKGILLVGPPGTGKTLLARAVAGEAGVPFFSISGSDFVEMFVGVGAARVRHLFGQAVERAPTIVFIDELDALGKARAGNMLTSHDEREQTLNQLLSEMDGFDSNRGVIIMAATNRPEILDPALLRPGRFDRQILVDRPDARGRERILGVHAKKIKLSPAVVLSAIAAKTPGFVGADLANIVNEAALLAARWGKDAVEMAAFEEAIERVVAGLQKKSRVMSPHAKKVVAYHESGHALVAELTPGADPVVKISIIPRGVAALGYTQQVPTEDHYLLTRSELIARIYTLLGGRVAEELVFGDVTTGAQNDLQRATEIARTMVTQFGMSERLGLVSLEGARTARFLSVPTYGSREYSDGTAHDIDSEVKKILLEAHIRVREILSSHRNALEELAHLLLEREIAERTDLQAILKVRSIESAKEKKRATEGQRMESLEQQVE
jgi:cell division protease FtsH